LPGELSEKKCTKCGEWKSVSEFYRHTKYKDGRFHYCKECHGRGSKLRNDEIKRQAIEKYGGACSNCSFDHAPSLTFHHKNGRREDEPRGKNIYRQLINEPIRNDVIILCNSCHQALHQVNGEQDLKFLKAIGCLIKSATNHKIGATLWMAKYIRWLKKQNSL